ncbi:hypothetical protein Aduo_015517 [Ancylostoma duodenale]
MSFALASTHSAVCLLQLPTGSPGRRTVVRLTTGTSTEPSTPVRQTPVEIISDEDSSSQSAFSSQQPRGVYSTQSKLTKLCHVLTSSFQDDVSDEDEDSTEYDEAGNRIVPPSTKRYIYTVFD